ncbi:hypothetical protein GQR58_030704 [Nymphon striatum]|nr:hypothetical protein GQR58_030704 [Nymphon striatum]
MNDCLSRFTTYSNFKSHLLREHGGKPNYGRKPTYHIETSLQCSISFCNQIVYTREALIKHLKEHLDAGTKIKCPISDCVRVCSRQTNLLGPTASNSLIDDGHTNDSFEFLQQSDIFDVDECIDDLEAVHETRDIEDLFVKNIMLFYLKLEAKHTIPATTVQDIVEQMQDIHSLGESVMCCSTGPLRSDHVRKATYKKMFQYVAPVPISLGRNNYGKERSFYYVPVKESIKRLFENQSDAIFKQLITDIKDMECTGIDILNNGQNVKGTVCFIAGDNLGSHCIGGFVENFSTVPNFCRYCLVTHGVLAENPNNSGELRTIENYKRALDQLQTARNPPNANHVQGIKFNSLFNEMDFFHVCPTGLPPCLGHDLFEGVVNYDMALFVQYYIKEKKWFTYSELNRRILHFKYLGSDKNNGLCEVNLNGEKLGGQAVQNWYFSRFLPLIIGYKISEPADPVWQMFLQLKDIVELVCAPKINEANIAYLAVLIDQYLEDRQTIFENHRLKPKHHYLRHYPYLILQFGPLIHTELPRGNNKAKNELYVALSSSNEELWASYPSADDQIRGKTQLLPGIHISLDVMEKKCIFIQCGNSSKKVVYSGALLSLNFISETAKTKFGLSGNIFLQYWDKDVDDFVDLDASSMEEINEEKLIKVRVLPNHSVEVSSVITQDQERGREPTKNDVLPSSVLSDLGQQREVKEERQGEIELTPPPDNQGFKKSTAVSKAESSYVLPKRKLLPRTYVFLSATCPMSLLQKLEMQQPLEKRDISLVLDTLYNDVSLYEGGLEKLKRKWSNERKNRDRYLPQVQARKRKINSELSDEPPTNIVNLIWGLANFHLPTLLSEDSTSITAEIDWLQREFKKTTPTIKIVDLKMKLTFPERRNDVVSQGLGIGDLLQKYPWLQQREQVNSFVYVDFMSEIY